MSGQNSTWISCFLHFYAVCTRAQLYRFLNSCKQPVPALTLDIASPFLKICCISAAAISSRLPKELPFGTCCIAQFIPIIYSIPYFSCKFNKFHRFKTTNSMDSNLYKLYKWIPEQA